MAGTILGEAGEQETVTVDVSGEEAVDVEVIGGDGQPGENASNAGSGGEEAFRMDVSALSTLTLYGGHTPTSRTDTTGALADSGAGGGFGDADGGAGGTPSVIEDGSGNYPVACGGGGGGAGNDSGSSLDSGGGGGGAPGGTGGNGQGDGASGGDADTVSGIGDIGGDGGSFDNGTGDPGETEVNATVIQQNSIEDASPGVRVYEVPPNAVDDLISSARDRQVDLDWTAADRADEYDVYRDTSSPVDTGGSPIATVTETSYADPGLLDGQEYHHVVVAKTVNGSEADPSNEESATTPVPAPDDLSVASVDGRYATFSWTDPCNNTDQTEVLLREDGQSSYTVDGTVSGRGAIRSTPADSTPEQYVTHPAIIFGDGEAYTYSIWYQHNHDRGTDGTYILPYGKYDNAGHTLYFSTNSGVDGPLIRYRNGNISPTIVNSHDFFDGEPHLFTLRVSSDRQVDVFDTGTLIGGETVTNSSFTYSGIGRGYSNTDYVANAFHEGLQVHGRALDDSEIVSMAEGEVINDDLIAHLPLDDRTGDTARDASGNGYDGTRVNGAKWVPPVAPFRYQTTELLDGQQYDATGETHTPDDSTRWDA